AKQTWTLWVTGFAPDELRSGLRVEHVEWWIDGKLAESVSGDPSRVWGDERYAIRYQPKSSGELMVECRVTASTSDGGKRELRSKSLSVRADFVLEPWMLAYARDAGEDVLDGHALVVSVSSEESEFHRKLDALDGLQGSSWRAKADDPEPWLRIEVEKGVRMKELWLSPAAASETLRAECVLFPSVELRLNDAKVPLVIEMDADPRLKTKFVLPKPTTVRSLELRWRDPPREPGKFLGLAEIEAR